MPKNPSAWSSAPLLERMNDQIRPTPMPETAYGMRNGRRSQIPPGEVPGQEGQTETQTHRHHERAADPEQGVAEGAEEVRVGEHLGVIVQAHQLRVTEPVVLSEAQERGPEQRKIEQHRHHDHARGDEAPGGPQIRRLSLRHA